MQWTFFSGAALLTAALLLPYADPAPILAGTVVAGIVQWGWSRAGRRQE